MINNLNHTHLELSRPVTFAGQQDQRETFIKTENHITLKKMEEALYNKTRPEDVAISQPVKPFWECPRNLLLSNIIRQLSVYSVNNVNLFMNIFGNFIFWSVATTYGAGDLYYTSQIGLSGLDFFLEMYYQKPSPLAGQGLDYYLKNNRRN